MCSQVFSRALSWLPAIALSIVKGSFDCRDLLWLAKTTTSVHLVTLQRQSNDGCFRNSLHILNELINSILVLEHDVFLRSFSLEWIFLSWRSPESPHYHCRGTRIQTNWELQEKYITLGSSKRLTWDNWLWQAKDWQRGAGRLVGSLHPTPREEFKLQMSWRNLPTTASKSNWPHEQEK